MEKEYILEDIRKARFLDNTKMIIDGTIFIFDSGTSLAELLTHIDPIDDVNIPIVLAISIGIRSNKEQGIKAVRDATEEEVANSNSLDEELERSKNYVLSYMLSQYALDIKIIPDDAPFLMSVFIEMSDALKFAIKDYGYEAEEDELFLAMLNFCCGSADFEAMVTWFGWEKWVDYCKQFFHELMELVKPYYLKAGR